MKQHEVLDRRLSVLWEEESRVARESEIVCLLALLLYVKDTWPAATSICLDASDQDTTCCSFISVADDTGWSFDEAGDLMASPAESVSGHHPVVDQMVENGDWLDEDKIWNYASSLNPERIVEWAFVEQPVRRSYMFVDIAQGIEHLDAVLKPVYDLPESTDRESVEKWLDTESEEKSS